MGWLDKLIGKAKPPAQPKTPIIASVQIPPTEGPVTAYGDQPLRKEWAESVLLAEGVPINAHLPMIESEAQVTLRKPDEIAHRLRALSIIAARASGLPEAQAREFIAERGITPTSVRPSAPSSRRPIRPNRPW